MNYAFRILLWGCLFGLISLAHCQGQDSLFSRSWHSPKMTALQEEEAAQIQQRISYPAHAFGQETAQQNPKKDFSPVKKEWGWWFAGGTLALLLSLGLVWVFRKNGENLVPKDSVDASIEPAFPWGRLQRLASQPSVDQQQLTELKAILVEMLGASAGHISCENTPEFIRLQVESLQGDDGATIASILTQGLSELPKGRLKVTGDEAAGLHFTFSLPISKPTDSLPSPGQSLKAVDLAFLEKIHRLAQTQLGDPAFNAEAFREAAGMSKSQFYRKVQELTQLSPGQYLRQLRLNRAHELLEAGKGNVSEIAYEVGFNNLSYFSRCFRQQFGKLPSEVS